MKRRRILAEIHETAAAMHRFGSIDEKTMREFDELTFPPVSEAAWGQMAKKLTVAMEDRNPRVFLAALAAVIEQIGFEPAAQRLGMRKARLVRLIGPKAKPSFEEVRAVVSGLGFRWGVARRPAEKARPSRVRSPRPAVDTSEGLRLRSGERARRLAALGGGDPASKPVPRSRSRVKATTHRQSEHDTKHITPAGRSALFDLAADEDAVLARAKRGSRGVT
jgi:DNA-binding phage protein